MSAAQTGAASAQVALHNVGKTFPATRDRPALHALGPIDLELRRGEFFAVVGPSGCGKSTLLDVLAGLAQPSEGYGEFEGKRVTDVPDGVGVVFQEDASFSWLTVHDNIAFGLRRAGIAAAEIKRRVDYAIGFMGLRDFATSYPAQLSGGMRMRVSIARALVTEPSLLLLDEPFAALDEITRFHLEVQLRELWRRRGMTVIFVTHSISEATFLANRAIVLARRGGRIKLDRRIELPPERNNELRADPQLGREMSLLLAAMEEE